MSARENEAIYSRAALVRRARRGAELRARAALEARRAQRDGHLVAISNLLISTFILIEWLP